jgi:hypothetical protein
VDQEVAKTLGELELKLQQLEHELTSIGHNDAASHHVSADASAALGGSAHASLRPDGSADASSVPLKTPDVSSDLGASSGLDASTSAPGSSPVTQPQASGRLVDEAVEAVAREQALVQDDSFAGPPVFGGEEVPAIAEGTVGQDWKVDVRETAYGEIPTPPAPPTPPSGPVPGPPIPPPAPTPQPPPTTPPGPPSPATPPPAPQPEPQPIDVAELVRFKQKMRRTLDELVDEYSRLLAPHSPYRPDA